MRAFRRVVCTALPGHRKCTLQKAPHACLLFAWPLTSLPCLFLPTKHSQHVPRLCAPPTPQLFISEIRPAAVAPWLLWHLPVFAGFPLSSTRHRPILAIAPPFPAAQPLRVEKALLPAPHTTPVDAYHISTSSRAVQKGSNVCTSMGGVSHLHTSIHEIKQKHAPIPYHWEMNTTSAHGGVASADTLWCST
ncbi:hypothetical protein GQ54DRAFT_90246 [Martensiomyces pterosporus]|nr:hypothetical protein GQ54DRAFT_90246 [Martensiomyces pterosporus]